MKGALSLPQLLSLSPLPSLLVAEVIASLPSSSRSLFLRCSAYLSTCRLLRYSLRSLRVIAFLIVAISLLWRLLAEFDYANAMRLVHSEAALPFAEAMARLDKADILFARARNTYPYVNYIRDGNLWGNSHSRRHHG